MSKSFTLAVFLYIFNSLNGQAPRDLARSVPVSFHYDTVTNDAKLKWIADSSAGGYTVSTIEYDPTRLTPIQNLNGQSSEFELGAMNSGQTYSYHITKNIPAATNGIGIITFGIDIPAIHNRGRCLIAIDQLLVKDLSSEIDVLMTDLGMDGWQVDTINVLRSESDVDVKNSITTWYKSNYPLSQALFILGHVTVPYAGNVAHDGHGDHQGAWPADVFYGEIDGNWTDSFVNNITPARDANKNIPNDGKYDQTQIPGLVEIEVGRVDFSNLPAFMEDEIELTRKYLMKNHEFRIGNNVYPKRALIENNFASFDEGFGQSGWRNFTTMFTPDSVVVGDYDVTLATNKYLASYACGPGSYTSAGGIGSTSSLWSAKSIQTVFTMTFGSYFGDWDVQNNFLRSALASGDILTNAWAGRPVWQLYDMSLGKHIGYSVKKTQNVSGAVFEPGFSADSPHIALLGDPTLRLHALKPARDLQASVLDGNIELEWEESLDANDGYLVYKSPDGKTWQVISELQATNSFTDYCFLPNTTHYYMIKAVKLEQTGSGSYFNTSLGIMTSIHNNDNLTLMLFFLDADQDGFGSAESDSLACVPPNGFVVNNLDCDDTNNMIYPDAPEIANNNIDENCDGEDFISHTNEVGNLSITIYPNPASDWLYLETDDISKFSIQLIDMLGQQILSSHGKSQINLSGISKGTYFIRLFNLDSHEYACEKLVLN